MEPWQQVLALLVAAVCIGWINNLAGAAGAIGLVALQELLDLDITQANVTLRLSALTIGIAGMVGFWSRGQHIPGRMWMLGLLTVPGALLGSYLALSLPGWVYRSCLALVLLLFLYSSAGLSFQKEDHSKTQMLNVQSFYKNEE